MRGTEELHPIDPEEARQWYLDARSGELSNDTLYAHSSRIGHFVRWCNEEGIDNLNDVHPRQFEKYKVWRREDGDINNVTLYGQLYTLRAFIRWAEGVQAIPQGYHEYVNPPDLAPKEDVRHSHLDPDLALKIREHLRKYQYASRDHVTFELLFHLGCRTGDLRALDVEDYYPSEGIVWFNHRPDTNTPLKNGLEGERPAGIAPSIQEILCDYIETSRHDVTDDHGRKPLITTQYGRPAVGTIRTTSYEVTKPCSYTGKCPVGKTISESCP